MPRRWATTSTSSPTLAQAPQPLSRPPPAAGRAWRRGMAGAGWRAREGGLGGRGAEWWLRRRATVGGGRSSKRPRALRLPPVLLPVSRTPVARVHKRRRFTVRHKLGRVAPPSISKQGPCLPPQCRGTASHRGSTFPTAPTSPSITSREPQLQLRQQTLSVLPAFAPRLRSAGALASNGVGRVADMRISLRPCPLLQLRGIFDGGKRSTLRGSDRGLCP